MDVAFQVQRPAVVHENAWLKIERPFLGSFPHVKTSQFSTLTWRCKVIRENGVSLEITANADFVSRRPRPRPGKITYRGPKGPGPKGFAPKAPVGISIQRRDPKDIVEKDDVTTSTSDEIAESNNKAPEARATPEEQSMQMLLEKKVNEGAMLDEASARSKVVASKSDRMLENGSIGRVHKDSTVPPDAIPNEGKQFDKTINTGAVEEESVGTNEKAAENVSLKEMEENLRRQDIERLAEENFSRGNKLFVYPQTVKPDQDMKVFLNRSLSTLNNEPDVLIMGAFNDWRWKSFTVRLNKTQLNGDWWSCEIHVPKEACKIDFVFFNGQNLYDNNEKKDVSILVEGGMNAFAFEDFLLKKKHRELEKLAKEQAERERQAEEQRQREAEKAASEADRAQAKVETEKRRDMLKNLLKNAARSVDNVWLIDPREFKGEDKVSLYYNKSSGPLAKANDVWIHGGHNNWTGGLSIVERLVKSERKDGDWWYADVVVPDQALVLDWVSADGPPQGAALYDNNGHQDFHAIVPKSIPEELFWVEEEH